MIEWQTQYINVHESSFHIIVDTGVLVTLLRWLIENINLIFSDIYTVYMEIVLFPIGNNNGHQWVM